MRLNFQKTCSVLIVCLSAIIASPENVLAEAPLPSWADGPSRKAIISFVEKVTKEGSTDFVPVSERIATFDNDGTLWSEQPVYFQG